MQVTNAKAATPREAGAARSPTNRLEPTTQVRRGASPGRREDRREWRPVRLGDLIEAAMAGVKVVEARP